MRAATRRSPLALWQAEHVAGLLRAVHTDVTVELVAVETEGDQRLDVPISALGGKGVFAKQVQAAVLDGRADFAVHSAKDLPAVTVEGLALASVPERGDARDALVGAALDTLADGAPVATGSQRRRAQLAALRPDLTFSELRGNMATRLSKVPEGGAIVVAAVALERLGLGAHLTDVLAVEQMIPQVGQGALGIECRADDDATHALLASIEHGPTRRLVDAERAFLVELGGDCDLPAGAHARFVAGDGGIDVEGPTSGPRSGLSSGPLPAIRLNAFLASAGDADAQLVRHRATGDDPVVLGTAVARHLRAALAG
ncbi:hydroxymethylbilane synthase [soil metagenome]